MYRPENLSIDGTRFLGRWNGIIPVYDVLTMQGLNAIVGCVKHNNAAYGTVLYRGQTELHPKLIPSILHGNPDKVERKKREKSVDFYVDKILNDALMQGTLHFGEDLAERTNYKKIVVEAMLQHYGVRTYCHDFVDNHWTALWFSLYELKKEREKGQSKKTNYYISAITYGRKHAITASFVLPSLIEQGLSTNLQNRLLFKSICSLPDDRNLSRPLDTEEQEYISAFLHNTRNFQFNASESYVMGKMYELFVREGVLKASAEMEMILTGVGHERQKKLTRTLNALLETNFARKEIRTEYLELMKDLFVKLNIRNSIMHGVGETFDYLNLGIVSIMFQLIWDIATCEIFKDEV